MNSAILDELFRGFYIQRWNDRIRPMELFEMDKHAHKMIIAFCIAKYEEGNGRTIDWNDIIRSGIYELLRRIIISDIKSPIYREIRKNKEVFLKLNSYVVDMLEQVIIDKEIKEELKDYLFNGSKNQLSSRILEAAHIYASYWEFRIIKNSNPFSYQNVRIETELLNDIYKYSDLEGIYKIVNRHTISNFIDLCGQLRFQIRWAQIPRVPKTSVLGHSMLVATIAYFISRENSACPQRLYNNFFGGLFHDLPEAVTRDIISPVKSSSQEFEKLLKNLEKELADIEIFPLLEPEWTEEIKYFVINEFSNKITMDDNTIKTGISFEEINENYNLDKFKPYDGEIIRVADLLAAFLEAWNSCSSGIITKDLKSAAKNIKNDLINKKIGRTDLKTLFLSFDTNF